MALFVLLQMLSALWSTDTQEALRFIRLYGYWLIIPVLATSIKSEWVRHIITAFLLGMLLSEVLAYGMYFELWTIRGHGPEYPSPFMMHIDYSVFLAFTAILLLNRLFSSRYTLTEKLLLLLFFLSVTGNLFISIGRTGQVAFLLTIFVATVIHFRLSVKSILLFVITSSILFAGAYQLSPNFQKRVASVKYDIDRLSNGAYGTSLGLRAAFWIISWDIIKEHPVLGVGSGDYKLAAQDILEKNTYHFSAFVKQWLASWHYHSQYLMIAVQTGLTGLVLLFAMLLQFYRLKIADPELRELSILFITVFAISLLAEPLWIKQFTLALFILFSGLFIAAGNDRDEKSRELDEGEKDTITTGLPPSG